MGESVAMLPQVWKIIARWYCECEQCAWTEWI